MGFWSGFAQGWEAESERIERRKLFQQEQRDKRVGVLAELINKGYGRAAGGIPGAGESDATPASADHYITVLGKYGMTPEQVGKINSEGGVYGLQAAVQVIQDNEGMITPELLARIPDSIVVTQRDGGTVNPETLAENLFGPDFMGSLEPEQKAILDLTATQAGVAEPYVTTTFNQPEPVKPTDVNQVIDIANQSLMSQLVAKQREAEERSKSAATPEEQAAAIAEASRFEALQTQVENGNVVPAIEAVGASVIGPYLENNPQLKANPELLGPWGGVAQQYLEQLSGPQVGDTDIGPDGQEYRFLGGDPSDPNNWEPI